MLLRRLRLVNYGGIYNGMNLYEINIDFTKCKNRIILIRGDNGSGKTTIEQALKPLPDSNGSFIAGKTAIKEIDYYDEVSNIIYCIQFIHECKANGERSNAKGYIKKVIVATGEICELNPNGNITSCKDIIYEEFQLDPNYLTLTQLSSTDRGLADKRPADRKKYVNAIVNTTEVYNDLHKKLSKKSTTYKGLMGSIVSKLDSIGDKGKLDAELAALNSQIKSLSDSNTQAIQFRSSAEGSIRELDPDGSFITRINSLYDKENNIRSQIKDLRSTLNEKDLEYVDHTSTEELKTELNKVNSKILNCENMISKYESNVESLLQSREVSASELQVKTSKLQSINSGMSYSQCIEIKKKCEERMNFISQEFSFIDNLNDISQEEYISTITALKELNDDIKQCSNTSIDAMSMFTDNYSTSMITECQNSINDTESDLKMLRNELSEQQLKLCKVEEKENLAKALDIRPDGCKFNDCPYIKQAYLAREELTKKNYNSEIILQKIKEITFEIEKVEKDLQYHKEYKEIINFIERSIKKIDLFKRSLSKFNILDKNSIGNSFEFFKNIIYNPKYTESIFNKLYDGLDHANYIEEYKSLDKEYNRINMELKSLESQADFIELLEKDIKSIQEQLNNDIKEIDMLQISIKDYSNTLSGLKDLKDKLERFIVFQSKHRDLVISLKEVLDSIEAEKIKIDKINKYRDVIDNSNKVIQETDIQLKPLLERREMINYQLNLMTQYIQELDEYKTMYDKIETLKYYSSPTTGIQLLFTNIYMNKILDNANKLLCNLFNGQFALLPFIITENEFRIPVAVDGGLNHDDITTMSSAQIALLSMIISISLLSQTSTKLNIIVGDEIDAPFDGTNRREFFDILDKLRIMVHANQCVLISHNSELSQYDCDIILLKNENSDDKSNVIGNVIWSYYNQ